MIIEFLKLKGMDKDELQTKLISLEDFLKEVLIIQNNIREKKYGCFMDRIPCVLRHEVWKKYISNKFRQGKCFCCRKMQIEESNFECGHVISRKNNGPSSLDNLRPICSLCNKSMNIQNMYEFISSCGFWINTNPNSIRFKPIECLKFSFESIIYACEWCKESFKIKEDLQNHQKTTKNCLDIQIKARLSKNCNYGGTINQNLTKQDFEFVYESQNNIINTLHKNCEDLKDEIMFLNTKLKLSEKETFQDKNIIAKLESKIEFLAEYFKTLADLKENDAALKFYCTII